ncbi:MAG: outer membrane protein assembly factor BamD, partial [Lentisphaeria bacterium]|nr:outer membrane protein assembly factor BamD [Lentisphaeria bacterium]
AHTPASVRHLCEARLSLAENMLKERRVGNARNTLFRLRDFAKTKALKNEILRGDIDYAVCRSYLLDGSNADAKTLAKPEVERFLRAFPAHPSAVHAAFELAKLERTPIAWQAFLDRKTYQLPTGVAAKTHHRGAKESPEKAEEELRAEAQFLLGAALLADGQFDAALQAWRVYEIRYPRGPRWKQTHQRTSDAQYARVLDPLRKKNWLKAEKSAELFLQENPMDKRAQRLLFVLGMIPLEKAGDEPDAASVEEALRRWERLRRKFPKSSESYVALVRGGRLCEDILQDPQRAAAYRQRGSYGRSGTNAHKLEQHLYKVELQARTERVFSCAETAKIVLETRNIERVSIRVHNIDLPAFFRTGGGFYGLAELDVELIAPDKQWDLDIPSYRKFLRQKTEIEIPFDATKPGVCMVVVEAGDTRAKTIVVRSNLELTMHVTRQSALAFVRDTTTNKGVPGTEVTVSHGEQFISAKTAEDGVCRLRFEKSGKPETLLPALATRDGHVAFTDAEIAKLNSTKTRRQYAYLYTDRHAVRPGETVGVRAILRDIVDGAYVLPKEKQWRIQLLSPGSAGLVAEHTVTLSEFGTVHTEFAIPAAAATGHYWVQILPIVRDGEHADSRRQRVLAKYRFKVATFELESSRLTFEFDRKAFFRGETIRGSVTAQRAWGAPIVGQTLGLTFPDGRSRRLTTDATGRITFEFSTAGRVAGETLTFSADIVGEDVSVSRTIALATKGFTIDLELPPQTVFAGEPFECKVTTRAPDGTPISREVSIQLQRRVPTSDIMIVAQASSDLSEGRPVQVETVRVTTDAKTGVGTVTLTPKAGGTHRVEASGKDRHGVRVEDAGEIDVSGDDDNVRLRILADGKPLKAGAKAAPRVHSRLPDGTLALVVWERGDILRHEVRELRKGKHPLEFDVEQRMYPKFKLVCLASAEGKLHSAENTFGVIRELRIEIEPAEPSHRPGTETTLRLRVTDQLGDPVRAELALALVNEMLFDAFPHPRLFPELGFRNALGKISESDSGSWGSADFSWSGGELESAEHLEPARLFRCSQTRASADDIDFGDDDDDDDDFGGDPFGGVPGGMMRANARRQGGLGGQTAIGREPRLDALLANAPTPREDLRTAHVWLPTIVTDEQGRGEVRFKLPGALAKWRTTLLGCTRETHVGATTVTIVTRKPLVAELRTPPFLREGDTVRFPVRIEAPGQTGQATLALKLVGENGSVTLAATATLANGVATSLFEPFTAKVPGDLRAELHVQLGALRDDVSRTIQILPWGIRMQATAGALTSSEAKTTLSLPQDTHFTTLAMSIALAPDTPESLLEGALDNTPSPLVEARTPSADLADVATELFGLCSLIEFSTDMRLDSPVTERVRARCSALLSELLVTQAKDGGWPCFAAGTSRLNVTLACVRALAAAQRVEMAVPEKVFAKARSVLLIKYEKLPAGQHRVQAAVLSALAERSKLGMTSPDVDLPRLTPLHRVRKTLDALGAAYAALACLDAGRKDLADGFLDRLLDQSELLGAPNDGQRIWTKGRNGQSARGLTALAAYALARAERYEEAEQALAALRREAGAAFLAPGAARGFSLAAAGLLCRRRASGIPASGRVRVEVNGHVLPGPRLGVSGAPRHVRIPRDWLKPIGNTIILTHPGNARFRYGATLVGFSPNIPAAAAGSATPTVRQRTIIREAPRYRGQRLKATGTCPLKELEYGATATVRIRYAMSTWGRVSGRATIEEPLPAGAFLIPGSVSSAGVPRHIEILPSKFIIHFGNWFGKGEISYRIGWRAPGTFRVPPTILSGRSSTQVRNSTTRLITLAQGEASTQPYVYNLIEHVELGRLHYRDGALAEAVAHLSQTLGKLRKSEGDVALMLVQILSRPEFEDSPMLIAAFEVLRQRHPDTTLGFPEIFAVGRAYAALGEEERAALVYRVLIAASFRNDCLVPDALQAQRFAREALALRDRFLRREYPDFGFISQRLDLAQQFESLAPLANES